MNLKENEKEILDLCSKVARLAVKVTLEGKYHVFYSFSGHVKLLEIKVFRCTQDYSFESVMQPLSQEQTYLESRFTVSSLKNMVRQLIKLLIVNKGSYK